MILYENGYIKLDYSPSTDILYAECPDIHQYDLLQLHKAFTVIVEVLREHGIKHFIFDFTRTVIEVNHEDYRIVMNHFASDLIATRLQKVARIATTDAAREKSMQSFLRQVKVEKKPAIEFKNFTSKAAATDWITGA